MKHGLIYRFLVRWLVCSLGLWVAANLLGSTRIDYGRSAQVIIVAGLILAFLNAAIRPLVIILSLPAILFSLGLFMLIINGGMVLLVSKFYEPLRVAGIWPAVLAGIVIGLVNYLVTTILEKR